MVESTEIVADAAAFAAIAGDVSPSPSSSLRDDHTIAAIAESPAPVVHLTVTGYLSANIA